jgi:hypothetical protein
LLESSSAPYTNFFALALSLAAPLVSTVSVAIAEIARAHFLAPELAPNSPGHRETARYHSVGGM